MLNNKKLTLLALLIISLPMALAVSPFNQAWQQQIKPIQYNRVVGTCDFTLPATPYRSSITYADAGVYNSRGECIIPRKTKREMPSPTETLPKIITPPPVIIEVNDTQPPQPCHEVCNWHKEKEYKLTCWYDKHHKKHCNHGWVWVDKKVCAQVCEND